MIKHLLPFCLFLLLIPHAATAENYEGKKIMWIDSYHHGYNWSGEIQEGIESVIDKTKATFKIHRMDTKRNTSYEYKEQAGKKAREAIQKFQPDIIIATDDNAQKHLIAKYYKNTDMPVVFAGVNWNADAYGYPAKNITGMLEVNAGNELIDLLLKMSNGRRVGILGANVYTDRRMLFYSHKLFKEPFDERLATTFDEWKNLYKEMQKEFDVIILIGSAGINDWNDKEAKKFVVKHTTKPTGSFYKWMTEYALATYATVGQEQGEYAAKTALRILDGEKPYNMPIVMNKRAQIHVNAELIETIGVDFPTDILEMAEIIE